MRPHAALGGARTPIIASGYVAERDSRPREMRTEGGRSALTGPGGAPRVRPVAAPVSEPPPSPVPLPPRDLRPARRAPALLAAMSARIEPTLPAACPPATRVPATTGTATATTAVRAGRTPDPVSGAVVPPLAQTSTFAQNRARLAAPPAAAAAQEFTYTRAANPTVAALEEALGALEDAPPAVAVRSGMAAITTLLLAFVETGDRIAIARTVYGGTVRLANELLVPLGIEPAFFDPTDERAVEDALAGGPRVVLLESPGNPTLELADVADLAARAHDACGALVAVDNTFQTPIGLRPLDLGADVSLYSTTKFVEGHDATLGGAIVTRDVRALERLRRVAKSIGCIQAPLDAWLTLRGITTLPLRFERHSESAASVAAWLEQDARARAVRHPSLASFPQRDLAERQHLAGARGPLHGGIVTFEAPGGAEGARAFTDALRFVIVAENLGAAETLVTHPATMTHPDVPSDLRAEVGVTDGLLRLSVGLEDPADITRDLARGLEAAAAAARLNGAARGEVPA